VAREVLAGREQPDPSTEVARDQRDQRDTGDTERSGDDQPVPAVEPPTRGRTDDRGQQYQSAQRDPGHRDRMQAPWPVRQHQTRRAGGTDQLCDRHDEPVGEAPAPPLYRHQPRHQHRRQQQVEVQCVGTQRQQPRGGDADGRDYRALGRDHGSDPSRRRTGGPATLRGAC
jgi:hypothetical protein